MNWSKEINKHRVLAITIVGLAGSVFLLNVASVIVESRKEIPAKAEALQTVAQTLIVPVYPAEIKIAIAGDAMFEAELGDKIVAGLDPFQNIRDTWDTYDLRVLNLETNISTPGRYPAAAKNYTFNAPFETLDALKNGKVDLVSLANNHVGDYGYAAMAEQMDLLTEKGVGYFGAGHEVGAAFTAKQVNLYDATVAFLGFNDIENYFTNAATGLAGAAWFEPARVQTAIQQARSTSDIVIVYVHWGVEHSLTPNARQREWARRFIDYGADLVVGAHPHVVQGTEIYNGKHIVYSLGNFIFVGMWDRPDAMWGQILEVTIENKVVSGITLKDYDLDGNGLPRMRH